MTVRAAGETDLRHHPPQAHPCSRGLRGAHAAGLWYTADYPRRVVWTSSIIAISYTMLWTICVKNQQPLRENLKYVMQHC
jgi:hypothetical protein